MSKETGGKATDGLPLNNTGVKMPKVTPPKTEPITNKKKDTPPPKR